MQRAPNAGPFFPTPKSPHARSKSLLAVLIRRGKITAHQAVRWVDWAAHPARYPRPVLAPAAAHFPHRLYERTLALAPTSTAADDFYERGKRANLALAAPAFDGLLVSASRPLSFWRVVGAPTAARGFRFGREINGGCVTPALGGGLCLISNLLFEMAVALGFAILERHGHTRDVLPPLRRGRWGLDATVFYPYVDLRFAPRAGAVRLGLCFQRETLRLTADGTEPPGTSVALRYIDDGIEKTEAGVRRRNRIVRQIRTLDGGALLEEAVVAVNQRWLGADAAPLSDCLTCGESTCRARPAFLRVRRR